MSEIRFGQNTLSPFHQTSTLLSSKQDLNQSSIEISEQKSTVPAKYKNH